MIGADITASIAHEHLPSMEHVYVGNHHALMHAFAVCSNVHCHKSIMQANDMNCNYAPPRSILYRLANVAQQDGEVRANLPKLVVYNGEYTMEILVIIRGLKQSPQGMPFLEVQYLCLCP